jgi:hypothetical protein
LILLLCNLPYPTLCASSLSDYKFCVFLAKAETQDNVLFMQLCKAQALLQASPLVSLEFSETSSRIYTAVMR